MTDDDCTRLWTARYGGKEPSVPMSGMTPVRDIADIDRTGVPVLYRGGLANIEVDSNVLVLGTTGTGKSLGVFDPLIRTAISSGESIVVTDPKGEHYENTSALAESHGYTVCVVNLRDPLRGVRVNPLYNAYRAWTGGRTDEALRMLNEISYAIVPDTNAPDPYWIDSARYLLYGIMVRIIRRSVTEDDLSLPRIREYLEKWFCDNDSMEVLRKTLGPSDPEATPLLQVLSNAPNTRACIVSMLRQHMRVYVGEHLSEMLSATDIDLSEMADGPMAVYLVTKMEDDSLNPLVSIIVSVLYQRIVERANLNGGRTKVKVNLLLDEFANIPRIPSFVTKLTTCRSLGIRFVLGAQSITQIMGMFPYWETVTDNTPLLMFLGGRDRKFVERLSELSRDCSGRSIEPYRLLNMNLGDDRRHMYVHRIGKPAFMVELVDHATYPAVERRSVGDIPENVSRMKRARRLQFGRCR